MKEVIIPPSFLCPYSPVLTANMKKQKYLKKSGKGFYGVGFSMILILFMTTLAQAQDGAAGIQAANTQVRSYFDSGTQLMYGVGALLGLMCS